MLEAQEFVILTPWPVEVTIGRSEKGVFHS